MNNFFAWFYEMLNGIFLTKYPQIFSFMYDNGHYANIGWFLLLIPLAFLAMFYFLWRYPYGRIWHWLLWILVIGIVTGGVTYGYCMDKLASYLATIETEQVTFSLLLKYGIVNAVWSIFLAAAHSLWMSRLSKIQKHLPF